jgi:hypothetical protein
MGDLDKFRERRGMFEGGSEAKGPAVRIPPQQKSTGFAPPSAAQLSLMRKALVKPDAARSPTRRIVIGGAGEGEGAPGGFKVNLSKRPAPVQQSEGKAPEQQSAVDGNQFPSFNELRARFK